jgi:hypothetical protein
MAGKKTFVAGEVLLAQDVNDYLMDQSVMVFGGTAARSSAIPTPTEGMTSYRSDGDILEIYNGSTWATGLPISSWSAYTPTFTGFTIGNGVLDFAFTQIGKTVHVRGRVTLGSTSSVAGPFDFTVPVTSASYNLAHVLSYASFYNGSAFNQGFVLSIGSTSSFRISCMNTGTAFASASDLSSTVPFTWGNGHSIFMTMTYQAA